MRSRIDRERALPALVSAPLVAAAGVLVMLSGPLGPLAGQMAVHIGLMNVAAPLIAAAWPSRSAPRNAWIVAALQMALLWAAHIPALQGALMASHLLHVAVHAALFLIAVLFWRALLGLWGHGRWHAVAVLLLTGKLACLLAALLVFSPRVLYAASTLHHEPQGAAASLDDQQLAGLLMVTACPLSYVVAGIVFAAQAMSSMARGAVDRPSRAG